MKSYAGTWQSFWWDGALVGTLGWRFDDVRGRDVTAASVSSARNTLNLQPGVYKLPAQLQDVSTYPALLTELVARGWSDADLAKLTWHNALRVLRDTESAARAARDTRSPSLATLMPAS